MELRLNPYARVTFTRDDWGDAAHIEAPRRGQGVARSVLWKRKEPELFAQLKRWCRAGAPKRLERAACPAFLLESGYYLPATRLPRKLSARAAAPTRARLSKPARAELVPLATNFARHKHVVIPAALTGRALEKVRRYYDDFVREGYAGFNDGLVERRHFSHNDELGRALLRHFLPIVAALVQQPVRPTYSYFISYRGGARLPEHRDRPQCQYTFSVQIDYSPRSTQVETRWAFRLDGATVRLGSGDALLFRGTELAHARGPLKRGHTSTLLLLHYVDKSFRGPLE